MRDVIKIFAAASILTAYALVAPTIVEAVPAPAPARKVLTQRLSQAGGEAPVSAVIETVGNRNVVAARSALPGVSGDGAIR